MTKNSHVGHRGIALKKKIALIVSFIVMTILLSACSASTAVSGKDSVVPSSLEEIPTAIDNVKVVDTSGDTLFNPKTLAEVEDLSDYIVRGHFLNDAK